MISPELKQGKLFSKPFPYSVAEQALTPEGSSRMLAWLEHSAPWKLVEESFYEQYEFSFFDVKLPEQLAEFISEECIAKIKKIVEETFNVKLSQRIDLTAHKLVPSQRIRIHNDYIPGQETHRLLIQLNRNWLDENGGLLIFFNSDDAADIHKVFRPTHNSSVAFAISADSHHAVSTIHAGERFTLVYSFFEEKS